jgi:hypothetical protein
MRVLDDRSCYMSALQELLITDLFSLSTSVYTEVCVLFMHGFSKHYWARRWVVNAIDGIKPASHCYILFFYYFFHNLYTCRVYKKNVIQLWHVIVNYILHLTIYFFMPIKIRLLAVEWYISCIIAIKNSHIRCDSKMSLEIALFYRWELHVKPLSEYCHLRFLIWDSNSSRLNQDGATHTIKFW